MKKIPDDLICDLENIKQSLYITAYSFMQNEDEALEMVSQTIFIILKKYKQLKNPQYFKTWSTRILINQCKKELKRKKKYESREIELSVEELSNLPLVQALEMIPNELRVVVELKYLQGYTLKEMSYMLDRPVSTIASQIHKALQLLKLELKEEDYE